MSERVLECVHRWVELPSAARSGGYYKAKVEGFGYDQSVAYTMLYCELCGVTKEVVAKDHRGK